MPAARSRGETMAKPRSDAYVGLLGLSLLALSVALVFAYLNWDSVKEKPRPVQMAPMGGGQIAAPPAPSIPPGPAGPGAASQVPPPLQKK
jgi:hypothetical protein